jgi:hypothetical protein
MKERPLKGDPAEKKTKSKFTLSMFFFFFYLILSTIPMITSPLKG